MADELNTKAQKALQNMFTEIDSVNVDNIILDGITIRAGKQLVRLEVVHKEEIPLEDEIREEYRLKLRSKLQEIKTRLNDKINDVVQMTSKIRQEAEAKEREMKSKLRSMKAMPDINWSQCRAGVSVCPGDNRDEVCYLIRGIYYPKTVNHDAIDPAYAKKLITPIIYMFKTTGDRIVEFSTRKTQNLDYFPHYHQQKPDCWGEFRYERKFQSVDDLINIKNRAEAVLENVNVHSIASQSPRGLPRKVTLLRHLVSVTEKIKKEKNSPALNSEQIRHGLADAIAQTEGEVWTT